MCFNTFLKSVLVLATICAAGLSKADELPNEVEISLPIFRSPMLVTSGYDYAKDRPKPSCVEFPTVAQNPRGSLEVAVSTSYAQSTKELGMEVGARFRTAVISGEASAKFARQSTDTGYTVNLLYNMKSEYFEMFNTNYKAGDIAPRSSYVEPLTSKILDGDGFWSRCGTHFVSRTSRLASLLIKVSLHFKSRESAQKFEMEAKGRYESGVIMAAANGGAKDVQKHLGINGSVDISVLQIGGDPGLAGQLLCPAGEDGKLKSCAQEAVSCSSGNFNKCEEFLAAVLNYGANNFSKQISENNEPKRYAINGVALVPYFGTNYLFPAPPAKAEIRLMDEDIESLNAEFERYFKTWLIAKQSNSLKIPRPSARQLPVVQAASTIFEDYLKVIAKGVRDCYAGGPSACTDSIKKMNAAREAAFAEFNAKLADNKSKLKVTNESDLDDAIKEFTKVETYAQACDLADAAHPQTDWAIRALMAQYKDKFKLAEGEKDTDPCWNQEKVLTPMQDIEIDGSLIESRASEMDLRAFGVLPNLKRLKITNARVSKLGALLTLTDLEYLDLGRNSIRDVCEIAGKLPKLTRLIINDNKVTTLDCLSALPALAQIDARGNSNGLNCPSGKFCKNENLGDRLNTSAFTRPIGLPSMGVSAVRLPNGNILLSGGLFRDYVAQEQNKINSRTRLSNEIYECNQSTCVKRGTLEEARAFASSTLVGDIVVIAGGGTDTIEIFNTRDTKSPTNARKISPRLSAPRSFHSATLLNSQAGILFAGGYEDNSPENFRKSPPSRTFDVFKLHAEDPNKSTVTSSPLQVGRAEHSATELKDGSVILIGGYASPEMIDQTELVYPIHFYSVVKNMPRLGTGRAGHTAIIDPARSQIFVLGGFVRDTRNAQSLTATNGIEVLNIASAPYTFAMSEEKLSSARGGMTALPIADKRWLLIGGTSSPNLVYALSKCESSPVAATPAAPEAAQDPAAFAEKCVELQSAVTIKAKGADALASDVIDIFDFRTSSIYGGGKLVTPRAGAVAASFDGNHVLVVGGAGNDPRTAATAEVIVYRQ